MGSTLHLLVPAKARQGANPLALAISFLEQQVTKADQALRRSLLSTPYTWLGGLWWPQNFGLSLPQAFLQASHCLVNVPGMPTMYCPCPRHGPAPGTPGLLLLRRGVSRMAMDVNMQGGPWQ